MAFPNETLHFLNEDLGKGNSKMIKHTPSFVGILGLVLVLAIMTPVGAAAEDEDPPSRVARLAYVEGSVSFQPAGTEDWVGAIVNRPLTTGEVLVHRGIFWLRRGPCFLGARSYPSAITHSAFLDQPRRRRLRPKENCPLRMRWASSMPAIVMAAFANDLNPAIDAQRRLIAR
jgi:hypothetical protein